MSLPSMTAVQGIPFFFKDLPVVAVSAGFGVALLLSDAVELGGACPEWDFPVAGEVSFLSLPVGVAAF